MDTIGKNIKELRLKRKISGAELAKKCNIPPQNLYFIENKSKKLPDIETLKKICNALQCTFEDIGIMKEEEKKNGMSEEEKRFTKAEIIVKITELEDDDLKYVNHFIEMIKEIKSKSTPPLNQR